uniref:Uncharacterized protein n=1 Tax=Oryza sativa subsp. japonica TaxID=39947 RepID=Q6Z2A6_ORYSJ|nr:hypothetical protein [Oryza sativa Japonica Group]BAD01383.1 hypothetical protein [Oryza sativa Japonica Group]
MTPTPRERESTGDSVGWCGTSAGAALHSHAQGPRPSRCNGGGARAGGEVVPARLGSVGRRRGEECGGCAGANDGEACSEANTCSYGVP